MGRKKNPGAANKSDQKNTTKITEMFAPYNKKTKINEPSDVNISESGTRPPSERNQGHGRVDYKPNAYQLEQDGKKQAEMGALASHIQDKGNEMGSAEASGSNPRHQHPFNSNHSHSYHQSQQSQIYFHSNHGGPWLKQGGHRNNYSERMPTQPQHYSERTQSHNYSLGFYTNDRIFGAHATQSRDSGRSGIPDSSQRNGKQSNEKGKGVSTRDGDHPSGRIPKCPICFESYNLETRIPKSLSCGHSVCTECVGKLIKRDSIMCPECRNVSKASEPDKIPVNVALFRVISDLSELPSIQQSSSKGSSNTRGKVQVSPHGSKCMEQGVQATVYCVQCDQWLCDECNKIDHASPKCKTIPAKNALKDTKKKIKADFEASDKVLSDMRTDKKSYERTLKTCLLVMRAAHESIEATLAPMQHVQDDSDDKLEELKRKERSLEDCEDVEQCLLFARKVAEHRSTLEKRSANEFTKIRFQDEFQRSARAMLNLTLHLNSNSSGMNILAQLKTAAGVKYHKLVVDAGRVQVHAAEDITNVDQTRALPIEGLKVLVDSSSTLTFLDLSWGGKSQGRVYIRLTGDTCRGRQFQALCLGDRGPSFKNTHFHRIWWKGSPGEHIWGGDYNQGDGSGGTSLFVPNGEHEPAVKPQPVTEGLVAGRYEKENFSTIFRIYTKSAPEAKDDAAFGRVEFGIDVVKSAINHSVVRDVVISDCGILIET